MLAPSAAPLGEWVDPDVVFAALEAQHREVFWLDAGPAARSGWSFVGTGRAERIPVDELTAGSTSGVGAPGSADSAGPFRGGWIGWFAYDEAALVAGAPAARDEDPGDRALHAERWVAFDHAAGRAWIVAADGDLAGWRSRIEDVRAGADPGGTACGSAHPESADPVVADARHTPAEYAALIDQARSAIGRGDAYQLCLTTRFRVPRPAPSRQALPDADVYRRLRSMTPAHHGGFVRIGDTAIASASPEVFLEVDDREGRRVVTTRPIKGTRPRGVTPEADARLARELSASEKERAENVMIVDLMRNDLARVCRAGTIRADAILEVESYPHVHQLVSTVSGELDPATTVAQLLSRTFPAGSMTGAPKLSAMTLLHAWEKQPRGVFSGCWGWVGLDGRLDLAMVIRTIVMGPADAYVGAGGGITWSSVPADEVDEVAIKARAPLAALGAVVPPGWSQAPVR